MVAAIRAMFVGTNPPTSPLTNDGKTEAPPRLPSPPSFSPEQGGTLPPDVKVIKPDAKQQLIKNLSLLILGILGLMLSFVIFGAGIATLPHAWPSGSLFGIALLLGGASVYTLKYHAL